MTVELFSVLLLETKELGVGCISLYIVSGIVMWWQVLPNCTSLFLQCLYIMAMRIKQRIHWAGYLCLDVYFVVITIMFDFEILCCVMHSTYTGLLINLLCVILFVVWLPMVQVCDMVTGPSVGRVSTGPRYGTIFPLQLHSALPETSASACH